LCTRRRAKDTGAQKSGVFASGSGNKLWLKRSAFPTTDDDGKPVRFRGEPVPATGFSIGVSRLLAALTHLGKIDAKPEPGPVIVTVFDKDRVADYQRMASTPGTAGVPP